MTPVSKTLVHWPVYSHVVSGYSLFFIANSQNQCKTGERCGNNYAWRQFEGHRCVTEIQEDEIPYEFDKKCDDPGVRQGYTFPEFR